MIFFLQSKFQENFKKSVYEKLNSLCRLYIKNFKEMTYSCQQAIYIN